LTPLSRFFAYNAAGYRVEQGAGSTDDVEYVFDLSGNQVATVQPGTNTLWYTDLFDNGRHWVTFNGDAQFLHTDWVGTVRAVTSLSGVTNQQCTGLPFGDDLSCTSSITQYMGLSGTFLDGYDNLDHFPYRQYTPTEGRWVTPDPAGLAAADPTDPQTWNRYDYVMNNPLSFIDPTGLACYPLEKAMFGSCAGFMNNGVNFGSNWNEFGILATLLGPGQTGVVTATIGGVPVSETATYYGGDLSLLNLIGGSDSWGWNFTKSLFGGFALPHFGSGSCLGVAASGFTSAASAAGSASDNAQKYAPVLIQAANPGNASAVSGALYFTANAAQQMGAPAQDVAAYTIAAGAATGAASTLSALGESALSVAKNPYAFALAAEATAAYGVYQEGVAAYRGQCTF
jgi:RHS repeat-associated protein